MTGTPLTLKERLFCVPAYLQKSTVWAAVGSVPFSPGLFFGNTMVSVAALFIIIASLLEALGIYMSYKALLKKQ